METLGVTARADEFFYQRGQPIPATWELMFSTRWARRWAPHDMKGRWRDIGDGRRYEFDTLLFPQFADAGGGGIGVMADPPQFVHFCGAISTYRVFRASRRAPVFDELFRLLLLSMLETLAPDGAVSLGLPSPASLAEGLSLATAPIRYDSEVARFEYPQFRATMEQMRQTPAFCGERGERIVRMLEPFDEYFAACAARMGEPKPARPEFRRHCLG
jgi:hypothetical protein